APDVPARVAEASENAAKARQHLGFLKRAGRMSAVVEHVFSGARVKVFVPRESCRLVLVLAGVRVGRVARSASEKSEPFATEALAFTSGHVLQHDVEIEIDNIDRVG